MDLATKRIVVTGGAGFLGSHLVDILSSRGINCIVIRSSEYDLTKENDVINMYKTHKPDIVMHLAAVVGGIGINKKKPGTFYYKNAIMGTLLIEHARLSGVEKFVAVGTICSYPKHTPVPFDESELWNGYPEETNAPYGIAKKSMLTQLQAYRDEFEFNGIYLLPVNLYGPRDNFDPESSHVIPALIKKCIYARDNKLPYITCWGTGAATREFLYVTDAAEGIIKATELYDCKEPVNLGTQSEISIRDLVEKIASLVGYNGGIEWDNKYPDGQPRRCLNISRAKSFGFEAKIKIDEGLKQTIKWYENDCRKSDICR